MSRLKLLKTKEQELISESEICNSLINQVLAKINTSIKQLELKENKPEFRSLYLSTLCLTDKLNEKLVEINLDLEDFILDKQIDKNECEISPKTTSMNNLLEENTIPEVVTSNNPFKKESDENIIPNVEKSNSPYKNESLSDGNTTPKFENITPKVKKSNSHFKREKLKFERNNVDESLEDVSICKQPASLYPATFLNRNVNKSTKTSDKNSNIDKKHSSKSLNTPTKIIIGNPAGFSQPSSRENVHHENNYRNCMTENQASQSEEKNVKTLSDLLQEDVDYESNSLNCVQENQPRTQHTDRENVRRKNERPREICRSRTMQFNQRENVYQNNYEDESSRVIYIHSSDRENVSYKKSGTTQYNDQENYEREISRRSTTPFKRRENSYHEDERAKSNIKLSNHRKNVNPANYEDESAIEISRRKCLEYLAAPNLPDNNLRNRRRRVNEQKRAIEIGPPGFKKSSLASVSTIEAHKNFNLFSTTDSYDSYESDRNFDESNHDKDLNTEKPKGSSRNSLNNFEEVNHQIDSLRDEEKIVPVKDFVPVKDSDLDLFQAYKDPGVKNSLQDDEKVGDLDLFEAYKDPSVKISLQNEEKVVPVKDCDLDLFEAYNEMNPSGSNACQAALTLPPKILESEPNLPKVNVTNDDRCIVTHAESPECFYIITATATENINDYDRFHEELQTYCESNNARKFTNKNEIKTFKGYYYCCFNVMEDYNYNWFRCKIIDWLSDDAEKNNIVRVLAVDDGFEKDVSIDKLRDYPQTKYSLPEMAVKCRLRNIYPPKSTKNHILDQWPQASIEFFNGLIQNSCVNPFYVTDVHQAAQCYEIDLCNNQRVSLSRVLVQMDFAVIIDPDMLVAEPDTLVAEPDTLVAEPDKLVAEHDQQLIESEFMKEQIKQAQGFNIANTDENPLDNLDDCKTNLNEAICDHMEGGYQPKDSIRLCKFTTVDGEKCFKGDNCLFEHTLPDPDGWTTDKVEAFTITNPIEVPKIGDQLNIMVTFIKTVCRFYAHVKLSKQKRQMYSVSKIIHTANQFTRYINKPENINGLKKFKILPANGQLVIARSTNDDKWYRARIMKIYSEDEFEVFFIDYGDVCIVKFNDLREIKREHLGLPEQAVEFRIAGIDPLSLTDSEYMFKAANHFAELTLDHVVTALVIDNTYPIEVEIYTDDGVNIGNYLKISNLAKNRDVSFYPKSGEMALE